MENSTSSLGTESNFVFALMAALHTNCYKQNTTHSQIVTGTEEDTDVYCPRTFDGFACWDETPAGATAYQHCQSYITGFDHRRYVYKQCMDNTTWLWTNYTTCVKLDDQGFQNVVNGIYVAGYSISAILLALSLIIFLYFRSLQCIRIRIHTHLFASCTIENILWIFWYIAVVNNVEVVRDNKGWCQVLHIITQYFMVTSYFWMFCEGLHLYFALVVVFLKEDDAMFWFKLIGWGASFVIMAVYSTARYFTPGATQRCWMETSDIYWIIVVPVVATLVASFVFLVNVVRVLLSKLQPTPNRHAAAARTAVKATLILTPLLGLQYLLTPFRPSHDTTGERVYLILSAVLTSFQGMSLAIIYCLKNKEVVAAIKLQLQRRRNQRVDLPMTGGNSSQHEHTTKPYIV